jgi:hypothetical protein
LFYRAFFPKTAHTFRERALAAASAAFVALLSPARASTDTCACKHLESVQQELENAEYLSRYFADLAKRLEAIEQKQKDINKDPTHPDSGRSTLQQTARARDEIKAKEMKLPHPAVKDYQGPKEVNFDASTCSNKPGDLKALEEKSSCKELGAISVAHENAHRALCVKLGKDKYLARPHSEVAKEESARYVDQAKAVRALLKKVVDEGKMRVSEETELNVSTRGFEATYFYKTAPFDLQGKSSPGADQWTLSGEGARTGVIKRVSIPGLQCTPYGQLNDKETAQMTLDGLKMSLNAQNVSQAGEVGMRCRAPDGKQGFGQSMRPVGESGGGEVFKDARVKFQSDFTTDAKDMPAAKVLSQGGMAVSGYTKTKVELVCPTK